MTPSVSTGAIAFFSCFAALAHMVSGLLLALLAFGVLGEGFSYSRAKEEMLDVEYIQSKWANRQSIRGFVLAADLCAAFAWALQLPALLYLCGTDQPASCGLRLACRRQQAWRTRTRGLCACERAIRPTLCRPYGALQSTD